MIIIEILKDDSNDLQKELASLQDQGAFIINSKGIEGAQETIQILIDVAKILIPTILAFVVARIESKRYITIKHNGMEVSGLTKDNAKEVLTQLLESDSEKAEVLKAKAEASKIKAEAEKLKPKRQESDPISKKREKPNKQRSKTY